MPDAIRSTEERDVSDPITRGKPVKTIDDYFRDWESDTFGFGYGSGEPHIIPALKAFLAATPRQYDYRELETAVGAAVAWLLINVLCHQNAIEYGTSPRFGWLTEKGERLKSYVDQKTSDELLAVCDAPEEYVRCYPNYCNCDDTVRCINPFWRGPA